MFITSIVTEQCIVVKVTHEKSTTSAPAPLWRRAVAEFLGAGLLVTVVVGSGIAAQRLSPDDVGLQLLENSLATALGLTVLILIFQPVSGAHLNPVVTLADRFLGTRHAPSEIVVYLVAQVTGGIGGAILANLMFQAPTAVSTTDRLSAGHLLGEVVATAGLVLLIFALARTGRSAVVAPAVGAYIGAAYWFTSSTSFANPAVTIGRIFTDTFAGIAPTSALWFLAAQLVGAAAGVGLVLLLFPNRKAQP
ncbi:glycerol uptake facilitator-like aquaporin [Compostimonas suwonensis]|jgi:glycerol uptake facilitator-like aquaporin|uniref:Glycerol uptake facilitator-like aquaporin n=1 Tax=Compostimonas suwonensis TaxID=1048394 RepID=A0A2M9BBY5_9MICO|nr:aquaporin family protein [Microbacterium sp.]MBN9608123.1 aquaporin family protein [Actinomycetota bacterium]MCA9767388.1 aquaporin family protein [Gemmatimonadota bacterium]PJJ55456.1 glycerol uptake facilitator-like aquaporin [Compostimonas suwonensis]